MSKAAVKKRTSKAETAEVFGKMQNFAADKGSGRRIAQAVEPGGEKFYMKKSCW